MTKAGFFDVLRYGTVYPIDYKLLNQSGTHAVYRTIKRGLKPFTGLEKCPGPRLPLSQNPIARIAETAACQGSPNRPPNRPTAGPHSWAVKHIRVNSR